MNIGFLHKVNTTPPKSGGSVHTYQVSRYLAGRGYRLLALANEQGEHFARRYPRTPAGIAALVADADLLYVRIDGRLGWEVLALLPGLVGDRPVAWEVNATLEEPGSERLRDRIGVPLRRLAARSVRAALCVSEPLVAYAHSLGIKNTVVVPNGSDPAMFRPDLADPERWPALAGCLRVLWAGSTGYPWHDFALLVECARRLEVNAPDIQFVVLGEQPAALSGPLPVNLHFQPPVPYQQVPPYFASADVGLCLYGPLPWSSHGFFFSPLKLFDYAASGVPVVYTNYPELERLASRFGLAVAIGDADALSATLLRLRDQPELRRELARRARQEAVERYSWERVGQQTEAVLAELLTADPGTCPQRT